jgi:hypothetical protein
MIDTKISYRRDRNRTYQNGYREKPYRGQREYKTGWAYQPEGNKYRFSWASEPSGRNEESGTIMDTESISRDRKAGETYPEKSRGFAEASRVVELIGLTSPPRTKKPEFDLRRKRSVMIARKGRLT